MNSTTLPELAPLVRGYLESAGFRIIGEQHQCLVADKLVRAR